MGSFRGHALPGSFFLLMGFWWNIKFTLKYVCKKNKRACYLGSKAGFRRVEIIEGAVKVSMALIGMTAEQFVPDGPHMNLYNYEEKHWDHLMSWQHATMYFFFGISGLVDILCLTTNMLPLSLNKLMLSNAFFVESFIFFFHTHGRAMLDVYIHQLLVLSVVGAAFITFLEFFFRSNIGLELLRVSFCLLQGSWFWQIGFVLYPPNDGPEWNQSDHGNMLFLTICFCWHYAFTFLILGVNFALITWLIRSRVKQIYPAEMGLLKTAERDQESEEEM
ncbi:transmembrane protein 45A [Tachyglossus aculeatus]|uniref:transmembrane protein 45A n=1 Tax=Tachyglossus aculeatus TaxID=9261 RepID=UPI0018F6620E|nr:transmembrane protein 45A [Tachyglossus aculeatus]